MPDRFDPIPDELLNEPSSVKRMIGVDAYLKGQLILMFKTLTRRLSVLLILTSTGTISTIVVFFFYFTRPTKTDILVFKEIQKEIEALKVERKVVDDLRDSLKKDRNELYKLQQKK